MDVYTEPSTRVRVTVSVRVRMLSIVSSKFAVGVC